VEKKVAIICDGTELYGVGSVLKLYAQNLPKMNFICLSKGVMYDWLVEQGFIVFFIDGGNAFKVNSTIGALVNFPLLLLRYWMLSKKIKQFINKNSIQILHCHWLPHHILGGFVRSDKVKVIWHIHNNMSYTRMFGLTRKINLFFAKWGADLIMPVSAFIGNNWQGCDKPIKVVRNGVYPFYKEPNRLNNQVIRCVIAGRLCEDKGHHLAVAAVINANKQGEKVSLDIYGGPIDNNPYYETLKKEIEANKLQDLIKFLGFRNDLRENHQQYDLGLQCRIAPEPCGVWICETLVDGLPLLASRTGGTPELVKDGVTGLLFESNNEADLTEKLIKLVINRNLLTNMREAAFKRGEEKFIVDRFINETLNIYKTI
jgi:glycosyltransferase involved in cell wall biosynthesis